MPNLLSDLNPTQQKAVTHPDGPLLVLAGAGSGKTRVLTYRIAWLIEQGIDPNAILGVTFTNKAANEMKSRVASLLGNPKPETGNGKRELPTLGTFHSVCVRILRHNSHHIGIPNDFLIYDETDANALIKQAMKKLDLDTKKTNPRAVKGTISSAKSEMVEPNEYRSLANGFWQEKVADIYPLYQKLLSKNQALDFDDLLSMTVKLFEAEDQILQKHQKKWQYILVDEYQDTNTVQYHLTQQLSKAHQNISVVGDASQSIYAFRGADLRNVMQFKTDYPEAKVINLERNYRSTQNILDAATSLIKANRGAHPILHLWTEKDGGEPITLYKANDGKDEAQYVVREIQKGLGENRGEDFSDFAVLYRTNAQSRVLEEAFLYTGIPYRLVGGIRFYERREIKDVLAYLRLIANHQDSVSYNRIVNTPPRGIGPVTLKQGGEALDKFHAMMEEFRARAKSLNVQALLDKVLETVSYKDYIYDGSEEGISRWENVQELRSVAGEFSDYPPQESLQRFLESVALLEQTDEVSTSGQEDAVTLMTLHAAKGLEFPVVFIAGMEEGLFPHQRALDDNFGVQEERRLCYVGITRAMKKLYLTHANSRIYFGSPTMNAPSRFLEEVPEDLIELKESIASGFTDEREQDPLNPWGV